MKTIPEKKSASWISATTKERMGVETYQEAEIGSQSQESAIEDRGSLKSLRPARGR